MFILITIIIVVVSLIIFCSIRVLRKNSIYYALYPNYNIKFWGEYCNNKILQYNTIFYEYHFGDNSKADLSGKKKNFLKIQYKDKSYDPINVPISIFKEWGGQLKTYDKHGINSWVIDKKSYVISLDIYKRDTKRVFCYEVRNVCTGPQYAFSILLGGRKIQLPIERKELEKIMGPPDKINRTITMDF